MTAKDPERDPFIRELLAEIDSRGSVADSSRLGELSSRIGRAAGSRLGHLSRPVPTWWQWTASWSAAAVPLAAAAGIAVAFALTHEEQRTPGVDEASVMWAVVAPASERGDVVDEFIAPTSGEWMLTDVLDNDVGVRAP